MIKMTQPNYPQHAEGPGIVYGTHDGGKRIKSSWGEGWMVVLLTERKSRVALDLMSL